MANPILSLLRPLVLFQAPGPAKDPDFVEKFKKLDRKRRQIVDTLGVHHNEAYLKAADAQLKDKEGFIDYEKLLDEDVQKKFVDDMANFYGEKAKKVLKSAAKPEDAFENELLTQAVYGTTREQIRIAVAQFGKNYTLTTYQQRTVPQLVNTVAQRLEGISSAHITEKHIDDIVKYTKADEAAKSFGYDLNKPGITREAAVDLLSQYSNEGYITKDTVQGSKSIFKKKK